MFSEAPVVSATAVKAHDISHTKQRPIANYHPSVWNHHFLSLTSQDALKVDDVTIKRAEKLKEEVREMLVVSVRNPLEKLKLVDSIQQLGIFYHFENEIDQILELIYKSYSMLLRTDDDGAEVDLHTTSLLFRLLRQQGYQISCDIFSKFMEDNGKFKEWIADDERGILSLYEAAHMRGHGEGVLEEALDFSIRHLKRFVEQPSSSFATEVSNALKRPIRKDIQRFKAREYIVIYEQDPSHNYTLLTFSKLDFNILQKLHRKELSEVYRWWKDLDVPTNFPFARDRIVECYFWILGVYFEPQFSVGRKMLTKLIALCSILDYIYDAYGTFEELQVLTPAIQRWDRSMVNVLPEYMKRFYIAMLDLSEEISKEIGKDASSYHNHITREIIKLTESYFQEAIWLNKRYKPKFEEYMELTLNSTAYTLLISASFLGMGDILTNGVLEWLSKGPKIIKASSIICRLMDDIVSHKFEQERKHVTSAVECYIDQYDCSEKEACVELHKQVVDAWKDINEACLHPIDVPMPLLMRAVNFSRVIHVLYLDEDGYTHANSGTKLAIKHVLVDPVPC